MEKQDERKYYTVCYYETSGFYVGCFGLVASIKLKAVCGQYKNIFGKTKNKYSKNDYYFYAIEQDGKFYEPITGRDLTDKYVGEGPIYCGELNKITKQEELKEMSEQIKKINGNDVLKKVYIMWLEYYSSETYGVKKRNYEYEQKQEKLKKYREEEKVKTLEYLNSYELPKNKHN